MSAAPPSFPGYPPFPGPAAVPAPPTVPAPPPGPGVQPPFPAPPVEGKGRRIGLGLGVGAAVLLLVCGGGLAAVIGLTTSFSRALNEQAHKVVTSYLAALHDRRYDQAYGMLCQQAKDRESPAMYRSRVTAEPAIASYRVGQLDLTQLSVPVDLTYTSGSTAQLAAYLDQNKRTGAFEVCELGE